MLDFSTVAYTLGPIIPFMFVLGVVYGSLEVSAIFRNKAVNFIIAVAVSFFALINPEVQSFIQNIIPYATILFIIVFGIMFLKKTVFAGLSGVSKSDDYSLPIIILMFIFIFLSNVNSASTLPYMGGFFTDQFLSIAGILLVLAIFYIAYKKKP